MGLFDYVISNKISTPIKLGIGLHRVSYDRDHCGNDARYMKVYIEGKGVTQMVAEATNLGMSNAKDTKGCLIIHGSGIDIAFALQNRVSQKAIQAGYAQMFDRGGYEYLGRYKNGKYEYK